MTGLRWQEGQRGGGLAGLPEGSPFFLCVLRAFLFFCFRWASRAPRTSCFFGCGQGWDGGFETLELLSYIVARIRNVGHVGRRFGGATTSPSKRERERRRERERYRTHTHTRIEAFPPTNTLPAFIIHTQNFRMLVGRAVEMEQEGKQHCFPWIR